MPMAWGVLQRIDNDDPYFFLRDLLGDSSLSLSFSSSNKFSSCQMT